MDYGSAVIDLRCHLLPGVDDGALDLADSVAMARQAEHDEAAEDRLGTQLAGHPAHPHALAARVEVDVVTAPAPLHCDGEQWMMAPMSAAPKKAQPA